jgi:azurin
MTKTTLIAAACLLGLAACGDRAPPPAPEPAATPAPTPPPAAEPAPAPADTTTPAPATAPTPAAGEKPAATVTDCTTEIEANDAMQFNVSSITVPASCTQFTIKLKHVGQMPVAAMGHNVVIARQADMQGVATDGMAAGAAGKYVKAGDTRVIAHSDVVGGGQSTSVTFDVARIKSGGPFEFFCSFPGHSAIMKGPISVQ